MSLFFDVSGFVFGALGIFGLIQLIYIILDHYSPMKRVKALEETFSDAYTLLQCGVEEGILLPDEAQNAETRPRR